MGLRDPRPGGAEPFGIGPDLTELVLSPHYQGDSLAPLSDFPISVFIYVPRTRDASEKSELTSEDLELVAWGDLYQTETEAREALSPGGRL